MSDKPAATVRVTISTVDGEVLENEIVEYWPNHKLPVTPQMFAARIIGQIENNPRICVKGE